MGEEEKECTTECKSQPRLDEMAPGNLITGTGREEVMRKGGEEEVRSVRGMCDVCAAHGDRAAVGVDVDAQGISLREDETHFPINTTVECRAFVSERILVGLRWHAEEAAVLLGFSMSVKETGT